MKIGYKDFWVDLSVVKCEDGIKKWLLDISKCIEYNKARDYTIALVDERYHLTSYIIDYGKVHWSKKDIANLISHLDSFNILTLKDVFIGELKDYLIESTGELDGYEDDTPELSSFDFIIKV